MTADRRDPDDPMAPFVAASRELQRALDNLLQESRTIDAQVATALEAPRRRAAARRARVHAAVRAIVSRLSDS